MVNIIGTVVIPLMMIGFGLLWRKYPPKTINWIYGYRTFRAMKSQVAWDFAHRYFGKVMLNLGAILLLASLAIVLIHRGDMQALENLLPVIIPTQLILFIGSIVPTELALRKNFNKDGSQITR